jgi:hypothetical protein
MKTRILIFAFLLAGFALSSCSRHTLPQERRAQADNFSARLGFHVSPRENLVL